MHSLFSTCMHLAYNTHDTPVQSHIYDFFYSLWFLGQWLTLEGRQDIISLIYPHHIQYKYSIYTDANCTPPGSNMKRVNMLVNDGVWAHSGPHSSSLPPVTLPLSRFFSFVTWLRALRLEVAPPSFSSSVFTTLCPSAAHTASASSRSWGRDPKYSSNIDFLQSQWHKTKVWEEHSSLLE